MRAHSPNTQSPVAAAQTTVRHSESPIARAAGGARRERLGPQEGGAERGRGRANQNNDTPRQPLRPLPAATVAIAIAATRRGPLSGRRGEAGADTRRRRYEAPRAAAEANGRAGGAGGGANAGGAARAAAPGPAARLGVQVACGANHRGRGVFGGGGAVHTLGLGQPGRTTRCGGRGRSAHLPFSSPAAALLPPTARAVARLPPWGGKEGAVVAGGRVEPAAPWPSARARRAGTESRGRAVGGGGCPGLRRRFRVEAHGGG